MKKLAPKIDTIQSILESESHERRLAALITCLVEEVMQHSTGAHTDDPVARGAAIRAGLGQAEELLAAAVQARLAEMR